MKKQRIVPEKERKERRREKTREEAMMDRKGKRRKGVTHNKDGACVWMSRQLKEIVPPLARQHSHVSVLNTELKLISVA